MASRHGASAATISFAGSGNCLHLHLGVWACGIQLELGVSACGTASFSSVSRLLLVPLQLPAWRLGLRYGASAATRLCCSMQPFNWRRGLLSASPARPLFLVFRDCCLTPLKSSAAASSMVSRPVARRLCCDQRTAPLLRPAVLLALPLAVSISILASGPVASSLASVPVARPLL